jgi:hypothetical protein
VIDARLDARLRGLPGVLDCSVIDGGVALLVHPEVDARVLKARAQAVMAALDDRSPLVILGGMAPAPASPASPFSLSLFVVAVLLLLAVLPSASADRRPAFTGPLAAAALDGGITPDLARPRLSFTLAAAASSRARVAGAALVASGQAAAAVADPAADAEAGHGRPARHTPRRATVPIVPPAAAPAPAPAVSTLTIVRTTLPTWPGRGGAGRPPKRGGDS